MSNATLTAGFMLLEREQRLLQSVAHTGIPRLYDILRDNGEACLILEDTGALPLVTAIASQRSELTTVLNIAIQLVTLLADLHRRHITALHLRPHSILVHLTTHEVCLVDLSLASHGPNDTHAAPSPFSLPSLLPYISPEQTGRMNRTVDYRSDLYALGIILYEMLTGNCPFRSDDPLEMLHWLLAKVPPPPAEANPAVPEPLSQIVMKLLAKEAGERYQSALGLKHDLERCFAEWTAHQHVATFALGQRDVSDRFMIPQKLYGREREVEALREAFAQALTSKEPVLLLVTGAAGSGKTSLVRELYRPLTRERGYFLNSKCDQYVSKPYDVIIQILVDTIRQVLMQPEELQQYWRSLFMRAGGANLGVMTEMVPEMELIVGKQPPQPPLNSIEAYQRFRMVFQNFTWTFMRSDHPLGVMLLDDLQWVDADSVSLLPSLLAKDVHSAFYIGVYRDSEVAENHPLSQLVHTLTATGIPIVRVHVGPLALPDLTALVAETLHCELAVAEPLARLIEQKTGGNPFFVKQFLTSLHADGYFTFDYERNQWIFDLERIATVAITDNVVDLLVTRLQEFSPAAARTLSLAACIGNRVDLAALATVSEQTEDHVRQALSEGLDHGMLISTADGVYTFAHDRIQQAAYAVIPEEQKPATHLAIGRLLHNRGVTEDHVFAVVQHLNRGRALITDPTERRHVAELNVRAGQKAKRSAAYDAAALHFTVAVNLCSEESWETDHPFTFAAYAEAAECAFLCNRESEAQHLCAVLRQHAQTTVETAQIARLETFGREGHGQSINTRRLLDAAEAQLGQHPTSTPLQLLALTKAVSTLASEIELESLLRKMLSIAQEYAGVQRGCILEEHDGHLYLMGEGSVDREHPTILQRIPAEDYAHISQAVIQLVYKTGEAVVLEDASRDDRFAHDPYIVTTRPRSLICAPIMYHGVLKAIFYAENNLVTGAFNQLGLEVLQFLATQSAIALENARLYAEVKQEAARRRTLLDINNAIITYLHQEELFQAVFRSLRQVLPYDAIGIAAYDQGREVYVTVALDGTYPLQHIVVGQSLPVDTYSYPEDVDFLHPILLADVETTRRSAIEEAIFAEGLRSFCLVPFFVQGKRMGNLGVGSRTQKQYSYADAQFLQEVGNQIALALANARAYEEIASLKARLQVENVYLQEEIRQQHNFENIVGSSPALLDVLRQVEQVATTNATVLVLGETGTGKELIARAIHDRSPRKERPLVKVNCAAISAGLVESELFGHVRGAFTGAIDRRVGRFEVANGGTIFLDEVGELPLETQAKLLRVLQEQEFEPVGSNKAVRVDVRVVAATNRNLEYEVKAGRFRADLYYRLNVFPVVVPPLRTRREDIVQLVMFFLTRYAKQFGKQVDSVAKETMSLLEEYPWPGNIRELQNLIERAVVLNHGSVLTIDKGLLPETIQVAPVITPEPVPQPVISHEQDSPAPSSSAGEQLSLEELERRHIIDVLKQTKGVVEGPRGAAVILNLHPNTLRSRMKKLGIKRGSYDIS